MTANGSGNARLADQVDRAVAGREVVEQLVDHLLHAGPQLLDGARGERLRHQLAQPGVVGRVDVEDRLGAALLAFRIGAR